MPAPLLREPFTWTPPSNRPARPLLLAATSPVPLPLLVLTPVPLSLLASTPSAPLVPVALTAGVPAALLAKTPALVGGLAWAVPALCEPSDA